MAKLALVLVFSLILVLSTRSVVGDDVISPAQVDQFKSGFKAMSDAVSPSVGKAAENVKGSASSWTDWAKDKLRGYGIMSPSSAPATAPAPAYARALGRGPAAAPMV